MSLSSVLTAPDPAARTALAESLARVGATGGAAAGGSAVEPLPAPPSCRTPMAVPDEAPWRRRLRVARSWWCAFVSGLG